VTLRRRANVPVADGLRLVVLDVPSEVRPGQTAPLAAYLLVEDTASLPSGDAAPRVELLDHSGQVRAAEQRGGLWPADWRPGDLLIQQLSFTVPIDLPPGEYDVRISLDDEPGELATDPVRAAVLRVRSGR
jgi:hypothetical protein